MCLGKKKTTTQNKKISPKTRKKTRNHIFKYIELLKIFDTWELSDVFSLLFVETHKAGSFFFINLQLISYFGSCSTWKHPGKNFLASGESFCNWLVLWMHRTEEDSTVFLFIFLKNLMRGCWCLIWLFLSFFFFFLPTNMVMDFTGHVFNCYFFVERDFYGPLSAIQIQMKLYSCP